MLQRVIERYQIKIIIRNRIILLKKIYYNMI